MQSPSPEDRFVVAVLCPDASFSHLLDEARKRNLTILEMIPFRPGDTNLTSQARANRPVFFVYGEGKSILAESAPEIASGLAAC